ncbi:MAG: hypothetical protein IJS26_05170 [Alphaproteobacteria bacterium]|nr:hypothetical protein [Alphaproteobacteria bacterium]
MRLFKRKKYPWEEDEEENNFENPADWTLRQELEKQFQSPIHDKSKTSNPFANIDTSNMNLRQELKAKFDALEGDEEYDDFDDEDAKRRKALEYANQLKQRMPDSLDIENDLIKNDNSLSPMEKIGKMTWNNFKNFNPGIRMGEVAGELAASKEEMEEVNSPGYDNYAHRYGMYTNAKDGLDKAVYTLGGGALKEVKDIYDKSIKGNRPWGETLRDSYKDTLNNIEAVSAATKNNFQGNDIDGRLWLDDFDYLHNRWRRRRRR